MTFLLSKIVWGAISPGALLLYAVAGGLLLHRRRPRWSRLLLGVATLALLALEVAPLAYWVASPLEQRFPIVRTLPDHVDGVIVLGGAIDSDSSNITGQPELLESAERLFAFIQLARRYPQAQLGFSGGSGLVRHQDEPEADIARHLFAAQGLDTSHIVFERDSRNTWENALYSKRLLHPQPGQTWLLITSAWHMPRAVGCFRRIGWNVTAYPVDHLAPNPDKWFAFEPELQLRNLALVTKEWVGLVSYYALGRTSAVFPGP